MTPHTTTKPALRALAGALALALAASTLVGCGSGNQDLAWEPPQFPRRSDLGDLAPNDGRNQRLFDDATMTLDMPDGRTYTIPAELLWIVLYSPDRGDDRAVDRFEFRHPSGRDDAAMIPLLAELAATVDYQFDEQAATDFVTSNDDGFRMWPKRLTHDDYGIALDVEDDLNNTVMLTVYFPVDGRVIEEPSDDFEPHPFNGRPIDD